MKKHKIILCIAFIFSAVFIFQANSYASDTGYLGVYVEELTKPMKIALSLDYGLIVAEVAKDSPAEKSGIKEGDVILNINNEKMRDYNDLKNIVGNNPDKEVSIEIFTSGKKKNLKIKVGKQKESFYKWKWEGESSPHEDSGRMMFPFGYYPFNSEEIEKMRDDQDELRENLENLYKDLGKEYKKRENKKKKMEEPSSQEEKSDFDRFPRGFHPNLEI